MKTDDDDDDDDDNNDDYSEDLDEDRGRVKLLNNCLNSFLLCLVFTIR